MRTILPKEPYLLKHGKALPYGVYDDIINHPQTSFWDKSALLSIKRFSERKTWIFFGVYSPDLFAGIAIVDAGFVSTAFTYFYVPSRSLFIEDKTTLPASFKVSFDPNMNSHWKLGTYDISTLNDVMHFAYKGKFNLALHANLNEKGLSTVAPSHDRPFNFTYKNLLLPISLDIDFKGEKFRIEGNYGGIDFTKGYPPKSTKWNWASAIGTTDTGKSIAFNIVKHFNGELENALWWGDQRILLDKSEFTLPKILDKDVWQISTTDNIIHASFRPNGARSENLNIVAMKSIFTQPFGTFEGTISVDGSTEKFTAYGVCEDHLAVW